MENDLIYYSNIMKLVQHPDYLKKLQEINLIYSEAYPITLDIAPTNQCNLNCEFCSVSKREKNLTINKHVAFKITQFFIDHGLKSIELTGGGEPTLWRWFNNYVEKFSSEVELGLITNGHTLHRIPQRILNKFTWIRVSLNDIENGWIPEFEKPFIPELSFNYVWHDKTSDDYIKIFKILESISDKYDAVVKIQEDIYRNMTPGEITFVKIKQRLFKKLIFSQKNKNMGSDSCFMPYLKPHLHADGYIYRCSSCVGLQKKYDIEYRFCDSDFLDVAYGSIDTKFDTSKCKCFYTEQNKLCDLVYNGMKHGNFV